MVAITRNCAGTMSRRSVTSSPILIMAPQPHGQAKLAGSITRSSRGSSFGIRPRLRLAAGLAIPSGGEDVPVDRAFASSTSATAASRSSKASCRASASSFSDRLP